MLKLLVAFWTAFVVLFLLRNVTEDWASGLASLTRRIPVAILGGGLCWLMAAALRAADPRGLLSRVVWVVALSAPLGALLAISNAAAFRFLSTPFGEGCIEGRPCDYAFLRLLAIEYSVNFAFVFLAWGMLYLSMRDAAEAVAAERRAGDAREAARLAELSALRYQVSPHFLFNCLNSLGALIDRSDPAARAMVDEMAEFLRYGLASDPVADVELQDEIAMQGRYLDIERRRFSHRLNVRIDIDDRVRRARIPSLLLQPLVENAVKHGVASTSAPVAVGISARPGPDGELIVQIEEDSPASRSAAAGGMGIGLRNVADRLRARFGDDAAIAVGPLPRGGFRSTITMPLVMR